MQKTRAIEAMFALRDELQRRDPEALRQWHAAAEPALEDVEATFGAEITEDAAIRLAERYSWNHRNTDAERILRTSIERGVDSPKIRRLLVKVLERMDRPDDAICEAENAARVFPDDVFLSHVSRLTLPIVYQNECDIADRRARYTNALHRLVSEVPLTTAAQQSRALDALSDRVNFFLAYQGQNDRPLQHEYGGLLARVVAGQYPNWASPKAIARPADRIRVGYASHYFRHHSVANLTIGWLEGADHSRFQIHAYYTGEQNDYITAEFRKHSDRFYQVPEFEEACRQIVADKLDIIVYPDIGMSPMTMRMAALRLAPVQCCGWGHPVTSGLPTVDYFLSSELMEPENGDEHYTERLVRLPNLGVSYPYPAMPRESRNRSEFELAEDRIVYFCFQSLYKYLPQYDYVPVEIAQRVPKAVFVWQLDGEPVRDGHFRSRIERSFLNGGLDPGERCLFLPMQSYLSYLNLLQVADVYLDSIGWSGGNTTCEAIAAGLPVVTTPGAFMRGRHSYGILRMMGIRETIAANADEYIEIAALLGTDENFRRAMRAAVEAKRDRLFEDKACITGLEQFYIRAVAEAAGR